MSYLLILTAGFLFAIRGSRQVFLQRPFPSLFGIWREATVLFLTLALLAAFFALAASVAAWRSFVQDHDLLFAGAAAFLLTRYHGKSDFFFLMVTVLAVSGFSSGEDFFYNLSWAWAAGAGIALFQTGFLGLKHKLLFSNVPEPLKGWPVFCLLAAFVSLLLWEFAGCVF